MSDQHTSSVNRRILAIDDESHILTLFRDILAPADMPAHLKQASAEETPRGYEVTLCDHGQKAFHAVKEALEHEAPYAMAFIDINMPDWDGLETAKLIRELDPHIYIVIVTGGQDSRMDELSPDIKRNLVLFRKPFSVDEILQLANNFTASWQRDLELRERTVELKKEIALRREAENKLKYRLKIEAAESRVSQLLSAQHAADLREVLKVITMALDTDRGILFQFHDDANQMDATFEYCAMGVQPMKQDWQEIETIDYPWWMARLADNDEIVITRRERLPATAGPEETAMAAGGLQSLLGVPITDRVNQLMGWMAVASGDQREEWLNDDKKAMRKVAELIAGYWDRLQLEQALIAAESMREDAD